MLDKVRQHTEKCIEYATTHNKERWDKTHKEPEFKVGDLVLTSPVRFNKSTSPNGMRKSFYLEPFLLNSFIEIVM